VIGLPDRVKKETVGGKGGALVSARELYVGVNITRRRSVSALEIGAGTKAPRGEEKDKCSRRKRGGSSQDRRAGARLRAQ